MSGTTSTCTGIECFKLDELFTFIQQLKDLNLYGVAHAKCCQLNSDGTSVVTVGEDCDCPEYTKKAQDDLCMFDYCLSWSSLADKAYKWDGLMETYDTAAPAIAAGLGGALAWFGIKGSDALDNRLPIFWRNTSEFLMITAGFLSAIYGSVEVVEQAVRAETDNTSTTYIGALFVNYGGETWIGDLLGLSEYIWVALYLGLGTFIAGVPLYSAMTFNKMWDASKDGNDAMKQDFHFVALAFLLAFGSFLASWSMKHSAKKLIAYFDLQSTDDVALFNSRFGKNPSWAKGQAYLIDMLVHTAEVIAYFLLAGGLVYLPHQFIEFTYDPESVTIPEFNM
jgi:hypothetical protein